MFSIYYLCEYIGLKRIPMAARNPVAVGKICIIRKMYLFAIIIGIQM